MGFTVKNKFRNPYEPKQPKKVGRLSQLSKANRRSKNVPLPGLRALEADWMDEKRFGNVFSPA